VPIRVGTARRWYHWLTCTHRPWVARRYSGQHEAFLNIALVRPLLPPSVGAVVERLSWEGLIAYRARLRGKVPLPPHVEARVAGFPLLIALHVGSGGGAPRWPLPQWAAVAHRLQEAFPQAGLVLTGQPSERPLVEALMAMGPKLAWVPVVGEVSLGQLITLLGRVNLVLAGSTGPLHIGAAVGTAVVGLFPAGPATGPWRWRPLSPQALVLSRSTVCHQCPRSTCPCIEALAPDAVAEAAFSLLTRTVPAE